MCSSTTSSSILLYKKCTYLLFFIEIITNIVNICNYTAFYLFDVYNFVEIIYKYAHIFCGNLNCWLLNIGWNFREIVFRKCQYNLEYLKSTLKSTITTVFDKLDLNIFIWHFLFVFCLF